ncbi:run domain Beclin-1-interacting and cysteine-rich domain-containing protein-like isoform X2 [Mercenaria mercenaria]|uniref:run domain Beclin-1-interacting and cysteine-rich domain-containing protein-like isoform X2 n=1 Tax=Mercenaria mercenaria TaxID=6596 RepID=UPI00234F4AAC|nr:run domain Beclin-1-interacting and cysteine-rich domain-containing protein-like isoform X2 [Mercenaria mercenaria]
MRRPETIVRLKHQLLVGLKTTVEGLLATNSSNVWSTYGGLGRLCKDVERILNHRLKFVVSDSGSVMDFWPFVKGLKWLNPVMTPFIEKIRKGQHQKGVSKGQVWVRESLREHKLGSQLKVLVTHEQHLHRHYFEDAFLFNPKYFKAMCICLQAVEENRVSLLADIDAKLLYLNPSLSKAAPSFIRSASLPMNTLITARPSRHKGHKSMNSDIMALAPPFSSPQSKESELCTSDEHAMPCNIGSSTSPEDGRLTATASLRNVLRKSGSDSPAELSPPATTQNSFSLYNSINSDPLLNLDLLELSRSPSASQENLTSKSKLETRKPLNRSSSETVVSKRLSERRASEMMDKIIHEDEDDVFPANKSTTSTMTLTTSMTLTSEGSENKSLKGSRVIFSDSESVEKDTKSRKLTERKMKHTHKRSRSDISGIKTSVIEGSIEGGTKNSSNTSVKSASTSNADCVDGGNGGYFPQPQQGQSLLHYLSSHDFHTCANLEKENAHFSISEALIAAIEQMKWNHVISPHTGGRMEEPDDEESDEEIKQLQQRIRIRKREKLKERARGFPAFSDGRTDTTPTTSHSRSESPFSSAHESDYSDSDTSSGVDDKQIELSMEDTHNNMTTLKNSGLSLSMASLYSDADIQKNMKAAVARENSMQESSTYFSAESVAISLLRKFTEKQLPKASDLQWLVTEQEAPQRLLPLPNSYPVSPDDAENTNMLKPPLKSSRTRIRGNMEWAPPRPQIIFNVHPAPKRTFVLVRQNYRCAGCGMKVEPGYAKRYRYCEYLGKYFCQCCHSNQLAEIPARILKKWDFTKYYVSNFARDFLTKISGEPLFNISDINPMLYKKVKLLDHIRDWRIQLRHLKSLVGLCRHASSLSEEISKLPLYWIEDVHMYSINDLISVKTGANGQMYCQLKKFTTAAISHVESCQFCQCFGFICEMCKKQNDVIFPYQLHKVSICQGCKTCFHKGCFIPQKCPKCARLEARKKRLQDESTETFDDTEQDDG